MKQLTLKVDESLAKDILATIEAKIAQKQAELEGIVETIEVLQERAKSVREQMREAGAIPARAPQGDNPAKIKQYLESLAAGEGARLSDISEATGIGVSSVAFALNNRPEQFTKDATTKLWRLKTP